MKNSVFKIIKTNMKRSGAKFAIGFTNKQGDLISVSYAADEASATDNHAERLPHLLGDKSKWSIFTIAI